MIGMDSYGALLMGKKRGVSREKPWKKNREGWRGRKGRLAHGVPPSEESL